MSDDDVNSIKEFVCFFALSLQTSNVLGRVDVGQRFFTRNKWTYVVYKNCIAYFNLHVNNLLWYFFLRNNSNVTGIFIPYDVR